jgi:hypothetical protein
MLKAFLASISDPLRNKLVQWVTLSLMLSFSALTSAHTFFVGLTDISVNPTTLQTEIIHQYTAHDIQNAIAEREQIHFSPAHPKYDDYIQDYIEQHFMLCLDKKSFKIKWIGLELVRDKMIIYQEVNNLNKLNGILVINDILVNTYPKQVNTVNYQDNELSGSLTFTESAKLVKIIDDNEKD